MAELSFNIKSHHSYPIGNFGTTKDVEQRCTQADIIPACADLWSFYPHYEYTQNVIKGVTLYLSKPESMKVYDISPIHLYARNTQGLIYLRELMSSATCVKMFGKNVYKVSDVNVKRFLSLYQKHLMAVMLYANMKKFDLAMDNIFCEWSYNDPVLRHNSVFCQVNKTARPTQYLPHQIKAHDVFGRDSGHPHYIVTLQEFKEYVGSIGLDDNYKCPIDTTYFENVTVLPNSMIPTPPKIYSLEELESLLPKNKQTYEYKKRLSIEYNHLFRSHFLNYIFLVAHIVKELHSNDIAVGFGRGSASGSLLCYLLNITFIDPIKHKLLFSRFFSQFRKEVPDIDIDIDADKAEDALEIISKHYQHVNHLGVRKYIGDRQAVIIGCKALCLPNSVIAQLQGISFDSQQALYDSDNRFRIVKGIVGSLCAYSTHSGGLVLTNQNSTRYYAQHNHIAHLDKYDADTGKLLKIDLLKLSTLSIIQHTLDLECISYKQFVRTIQKKIAQDDDDTVYDVLHFEKRKLAGIFQIEGLAVTQFILSISKNRIPFTFEKLCVALSVIRPGVTSDNDKICLKNMSVKFDCLDILKETYGVVMYQEQIMRLLHDIGKFSHEEVDTARRVISKKTGNIDVYKEKFLSSDKLEKHVLVQLWHQIENAGGYALNKSHAVAYSYLTYACLYLKTYYTNSFYSALLQNTDDKHKRTAILNEINKPTGSFTNDGTWKITDTHIHPPFAAAKGIASNKQQVMINRIKNNVPLTVTEIKLLEQGIDVVDTTVRSKTVNKVLRNVYPRCSNIEGVFIIKAVVLEKEIKFINAANAVERRGGKLVDVSNIPSEGYFVSFKIFSGYHTFKVQSSWITTTPSMIKKFNDINKNDILLFLLEDNGQYGFNIQDFKYER